MVDAPAVLEELARSHRRRPPAEQRECVERPKGSDRQGPIEAGLRCDVQREPPEIRVGIGLGDDHEAGILDHLARVELEVEQRAGALVAEEGFEGRRDVERVREVPLELAVALDPADHGRVEPDAAVEEERAPVGATDADALRRAPRQRTQELAGRVDRVGREAERARVDVGRAAGQRRERGVGVQEPVGGFVERAVAGEYHDDVEAVVRGCVREPGRVAAPRRLRDLDLVLGGEQLADHHALARRHRRRGGVDEKQHPHRRRVAVAQS